MLVATPGSPPAPAQPDIEIESIPVAETELEPPYKVIIHNDKVTIHLQDRRLFCLAAGASASTGIALSEYRAAGTPAAFSFAAPN